MPTAMRVPSGESASEYTSGRRGLRIPSASGSGSGPRSTIAGLAYSGGGGGRFLSTVATDSHVGGSAGGAGASTPL